MEIGKEVNRVEALLKSSSPDWADFWGCTLPTLAEQVGGGSNKESVLSQTQAVDAPVHFDEQESGKKVA